MNQGLIRPEALSWESCSIIDQTIQEYHNPDIIYEWNPFCQSPFSPHEIEQTNSEYNDIVSGTSTQDINELDLYWT